MMVGDPGVCVEGVQFDEREAEVKRNIMLSKIRELKLYEMGPVLINMAVANTS